MGLLWFNNDKIKSAFEKVKKDIKKLELKLDSFIYEKTYLNQAIQKLQNAFNQLYSHYVNAIQSYNFMHKKHSDEITQLNQQISQLKEAIKTLVQYSKRIKSDQEQIKQELNSLKLKIDGISKEYASFKRSFVPLQIENQSSLQLTSTEKMILDLMKSLKNELGDKIPVSALLEELFNGDRSKASTLSNYLNRLEQKGLIKRERKGRITYVLIKH